MKPAIIIVITLLILPFYGCQSRAELPAPSEPLPAPDSDEQSPSEYVIFPDKNLEAAIRNAIFIEGIRSKDKALADKPLDEPITKADLAKLTIIEASGRGIISLQGLGNCVNLKELYLAENQISDIQALSPLTDLNKLNLGANQIIDIQPLASLTNLIELDLFANKIDDISSLSTLTNLSGLYLFRNQINDISPLSNLPNLTELDLYANEINDISPLLDNEGLGEGDFVRLAGNDLDLQKGSKDSGDIKNLQDRGVIVVLE